MKTYQIIGLSITGVAVLTLALSTLLKSCNNYSLSNRNLTSTSRALSTWDFRSKLEYTKLKDLLSGRLDNLPEEELLYIKI